MTAYPPAQQATFEREMAELLARGMPPNNAEGIARGRAEGNTLQPPRRANGSANQREPLPPTDDVEIPQGESVLNLVERTMAPIRYLHGRIIAPGSTA
jgi:hypothetical protein